jgi:hypothetical protein
MNKNTKISKANLDLSQLKSKSEIELKNMDRMIASNITFKINFKKAEDGEQVK